MRSINGWLDERPARRAKLANQFLYCGVFIATTLFGGSLFAMMLYAAATPQSVLLLLQPPFRGGFNFFVIFNSLLEWLLLPIILFLNWRIPARKKALLVGTTLYYCARCWTYVYFVPIFFELMALPQGQLVSADLANQMMLWVNLSWIRCAIDGVLATVLLYAIARPNHIGSSNF